MIIVIPKSVDDPCGSFICNGPSEAPAPTDLEMGNLQHLIRQPTADTFSSRRRHEWGEGAGACPVEWFFMIKGTIPQCDKNKTTFLYIRKPVILSYIKSRCENIISIVHAPNK